MAMVWAAVAASGRYPLVFIDRGIKINEEYYRENVLKTVFKPEADKQHVSALPHSARISHEWL